MDKEQFCRKFYGDKNFVERMKKSIDLLTSYFEKEYCDERIIRIGIMALYDAAFETHSWHTVLPQLSFPEDWLVQIVPPHSGACIRFNVSRQESPNLTISVYFDPYNSLGYESKPYWEIYPVEGGTKRYFLGEEKEMLADIDMAIFDKQLELAGEALNKMHEKKALDESKTD